MISADLITERSSRTSSMRTGWNTWREASTTSIAVSTSSAPHTQKYCPLLSSCVAASCVIFSLSGKPPDISVKPLSTHSRQTTPSNPGRHQVNQREDKHPHQVDEVPVKSRYFDIMRVVVFRLQKQNHGRHDQADQQRVDAVVEDIIRRNQKVSRHIDHSQNRQETLAQCHHAQVNHADGHVQHMHRSEAKERSRELGRAGRNLGELPFRSRDLREARQSKAFANQLAPLHAMQHDERRAEK